MSCAHKKAWTLQHYEHWIVDGCFIQVSQSLLVFMLQSQNKSCNFAFCKCSMNCYSIMASLACFITMQLMQKKTRQHTLTHAYSAYTQGSCIKLTKDKSFNTGWWWLLDIQKFTWGWLGGSKVINIKHCSSCIRIYAV